VAIIEQTILRNTEPGHYKYYEITIAKDEKTFDYSVVVRWGRIESFESAKAQSQIKTSHSSLAMAHYTAHVLRQSKEAKGYVHFRTINPAQAAVKAAPVKSKAQTARGTGVPDRTELNEVPVAGNWWDENLSIDRVL
jgi:predicted DNA-binding WGR domain protein